MKNIQIVVTDNRTIVVKADTRRFGKGAIMYEGYTFMQCCNYIRRATGHKHFRMNAFSCTKCYTDAEGRTMPWIMDVMF